MILLKFEIEDSLREVIEAQGSRQAIERAVFKTLLDLKTAYWERQSRAPAANSYQGTVK